jgi:hypothetical protein
MAVRTPLRAETDKLVPELQIEKRDEARGVASVPDARFSWNPVAPLTSNARIERQQGRYSTTAHKSALDTKNRTTFVQIEDYRVRSKGNIGALNREY